MPLARGMVGLVEDGCGVFRQSKCECGCCEMMVLKVFGVRQNVYVFSLYRNPDLDDRIFDCLLTSMATVQAGDVHTFFRYVCDLNIHHQELLGSTSTNRQGVAVFDFVTVSGLNQLVVGRPMHVVEHLISR